ncbi:hypothetical protein [Bradyrhizobium sp. SZCCHNS3051]|uniref:hypothetical protein n=1 Tax=Bradyrhizobium sp. SZCCHNS3051 TaxID=3057320 RepID=UPI0029160FF6|nr:hypothetical protein [Bradyrhizobium sp. SZCCHNS3051]
MARFPNYSIIRKADFKVFPCGAFPNDEDAIAHFNSGEGVGLGVKFTTIADGSANHDYFMKAQTMGLGIAEAKSERDVHLYNA